MNIIILDTNIFFSDFWLQKAQIRTLFQNNLSLDIRFYLPEIVFDETINCFKKSLIENQSSFSKSKNKLQDLTNEKIVISEIDIEAKIEVYRSFLKEKFSGLNHIVPYPNIDHKVIADRAILRTKPFKESNKKVVGYRDTLIWITILEIAKEKPDGIVFITNNIEDFYSGDVLHQDLKNDIKEKAISENIIKPYRSVKEYFQKEIKEEISAIEEEIKNEISAIEDLKDKFSMNKIAGLDHDKIIENIEDHYGNSFVVEYPMPYSNSDEVLVVYFAGEVGDLDSVWKIDKNEYAFNFYVDATMEFEYYINKFEVLGKDMEEIDIQDRDWNDHVMQVSKTESVPLSVSIAFDIEEEEIIQVEYDLV